MKYFLYALAKLRPCRVINSPARIETNWQRLQILADKYRADPVVRRKSFIETLKFWITLLVFSLFVGPGVILCLFWAWLDLQGLISLPEWMATSIAKLLWLGIAMAGILISVMVLPRKDKLWCRMAMKTFNEERSA